MFGNFSLPELLIVGAIALIVIGPKDLPRMMRSIGKFVGQARGLARQFQDSMNEAAREADIQEFRDARNMLNSTKSTKGITDALNETLDLNDDAPAKTPKSEKTVASSSVNTDAADPAPQMEPLDKPAPSPETADAKTG